MQSAIRLLGVGSPHGDDRIGWQLVESVAGLRPDVPAALLTNPLDLLGMAPGLERILLVDACRTGRPVGFVHECAWPWEDLAGADHSTHGFGLTAALRLAAALGRLPAQVRLFGIEVSATGEGDGLCPDLARAFPALRRQLLERLDAWPGAPGPGAAARGPCGLDTRADGDSQPGG